MASEKSFTEWFKYGVFETDNDSEVEEMAKQETELWEDFGISEKELDKIWKSCQHAKIDADNFIELVKELFPNSKESQVKAWFIFNTGIDLGEKRTK